MMRICVVSTSDSKGGAAQVASRLAVGMRNRGHDVTFLVKNRDSKTVDCTQITSPRRNVCFANFREKYYHRKGINSLCLTSEFPRNCRDVDFGTFDIVNLHDVAGLNFRHIDWLSRQTNLVWTLHCMAPFTGNCIYAYDCDRWQHSCGDCPQFGKWPLNWLHTDGSHRVMRYKRAKFRKARMDVVGVSQWICEQAKGSVMGAFPIHRIHNGIDVKEFKSVDSAKAKIELGLDSETKTIAFAVASNPDDDRKGVDLILEAARRLDHPVTFLPMAITPNIGALEKLIGDRNDIIAPKHLSSVDDLCVYYSASDLIWHPSRADNLPLVPLEAMACRTPVIASHVGGVPEIIGDASWSNAGCSGVTITPESSTELAAATNALFSKPSLLSQIGENGYQRVKEYFGKEEFLNAYETLFERIISNSVVH